MSALGLTTSLVSFLSRPLRTEMVLKKDGSVVAARRLEIHEKPIGEQR
jgi:hypothetical protein